MAKGSFTGAKTGSYGVDLEWEAVANKAKNTSTVTVKVYIHYYSIDIGQRTCSCSIDGNAQSATVAAIYHNGSSVRALVGTFTKEISHDADGTKSCPLSASFAYDLTSENYGWIGTLSVSGTAVMDAIEVDSDVASYINTKDMTLGGNAGISWTPAKESYCYKLAFRVGTLSKTTGVIHPNKTTAYAYTQLPFSFGEVAQQFGAAATKLQASAELFTYADAACKTLIGSTYEQFEITLPENADTRPSLTITATPSGTTGGGLYIQNKSKVKIAFDAVAWYGATIVSKTFTVGGKTYTAESDILTAAGSCKITATVTDSRGFTATAEKTITVVPYSAHTVTAADMVLGNNVSVKWTPVYAGYRFKLKFSIGTLSATTALIAPNKTTAYTYAQALPLSFENVAKLITGNPPTGTVSVSLYTYADASGSVLLGETKTTFSVAVPENDHTVPTFDFSVSPSGTTIYGLYIQGKSKVTGTFSNVTGALGATIVSKTFTVNGKTYSTQSGVLNTAGSCKITATVTDSRGFSNTVEKTVDVFAYGKPAVTKVTCYRCNSDGQKDTAGTALYVSANWSWSALEDAQGYIRNGCVVKLKIGGSAYTLAAQAGLYQGIVAGVILDPEKTYQLQFTAEDDFGEVSVPYKAEILARAVDFHLREGGKGAAFGKYCEEAELLDVAWNAKVHKDLTVGGSLNGAYIRTFRVWGVSSFDVQTCFSDFSGVGYSRQAFFLFGSTGMGSVVAGVFSVSDAGGLTWSGHGGEVTGVANSGGSMTVTLPNSCYDYFTLISAKYFSV